MRYKFTIFLFLLSSVSWAQADSTWSLFQMENGGGIRPLAFQPKAENNEISKYLKQYDYSIYAKAVNTVIFIENSFYKNRG